MLFLLFPNMNFCILNLFIILHLTHLVTNTGLNNTNDDTTNVCTVSLFRRKRAQTEYTRWRANLETTHQFIVKVLDEDITTHRTNQIVAVNIQSVTKGSEKLIIGGARVPSHSPLLTNPDLGKDYTRFVPPSTANHADIHVAPFKSKDDVILPQGLRKYDKSRAQIKPQLHSERDESPPASPQFLPRSPSVLAQQYAPIPPVQFTKRSTLTPLTPRQVTRQPGHRPTRTSPNSDMVIPLRTSAFIDFLTSNYLEEEILSRTTLDDVEIRKTQYNEISSDNAKTIPCTSRGYNEDIKKGQESDYNILYDENIKTARNMQTTLQFFENGDFDSETVDNNHLIQSVLKNQSRSNDKNRIVTRKKALESYDDEVKTKKTNSTMMFGASTHIPTQFTLKNDVQRRRASICSVLRLRQLNFNAPRTLHEIVTQLKQWADESPVASWVDITDGNFTIMENPIYMMIVDDPSRGQIVSAKQTVMIVAGIQGKDHHTVAAAMYLLYQLIQRSESHADLLTKYRFWIIPVFNPDGYDYSMTFPRKKDWTKNLRQHWDSCKGRDSCKSCAQYGIRCTIQPCYGVNLDRNFEYQWIPTEELRLEHPCGNLYAGPRQLSEIETLALTHYLHQQKTPIHTFIAFKEGEVLGIMYPYSHTKKKRTLDHMYRQRASTAAAAAYSISGRPYVAGQTSEFLPLYAGGIEDWIDGHLGIDNTYTIMMFRPTDSQDSKLVTERVVHEAYAATDTLLLQNTRQPNTPQRPLVTITRAKALLSTIPSRTFIAFATYVILFGYG